MDNYEIARDRAQSYFLRFDQQKLIETWGLSWDDGNLYTEFLGKRYRICRDTGKIFRLPAGDGAGFSEVLSIFDFLCHAGEEKCPAGQLGPVNSLKGSPKTGGVDTNFYARTAEYFDKHPEILKKACRALGGKAVDMGDIGFSFPLFSALPVVLKFYHSDEDFPASVTLLWDRNLLRYIHYETVFYIAGLLLEQITAQMERWDRDFVTEAEEPLCYN